jgi:flagellin-like protein
MPRKEKRAVSPVIATVLIILMTVILVLIVFLWARTWLGEKIEKFDANIEQSCGEINYDASLSQIGGTYTLTIENKGNVNIFAFELRGTWGGNQKVRAYNIPVEKGNSVIQEISFSDFEETSNPDKLEIYPLLLGNVQGKNINRAYSCLSQIKTLSLD